MREIFGKTIVELAQKDDRVVLITGDLEQEMTEYKKLFPDRFFNMGLCEQSIISIAGGLAAGGMRPVVYSITPFLLERAFEQIKLDIDEPDLPVMLVGYSGYAPTDTTHKPLDAKAFSWVFKHLESFFPTTKEEVHASMLHAFGSPSFIFLTKCT